MSLSKKVKKAGLVIGTIISIVVILSLIILSGLLNPSTPVTYKPNYPRNHLFVDATYLLKTDETNTSVNITCDLYLTNIWEKESGTIKAIAYVIEMTNNFAVDKNKVDTGAINANSTAEIEIPLTLSNSSFKIEVLLFENDKLELKGELTIKAQPKYDWDEVQHRIDAGLKGQEWTVVNTAVPNFVYVSSSR